MKRRIWIGWVVIAAMLVHAVLLARHDVFMFKAALGSIEAQAVSIEDFPPEAICHHQADASGNSKPDKPPAGPRKFPSTCPVCLALVAAHAVSPSTLPPLAAPLASAHIVFLSQHSRPSEFRKFRSPPSRGPPAFV